MTDEENQHYQQVQAGKGQYAAKISGYQGQLSASNLKIGKLEDEVSKLERILTELQGIEEETQQKNRSYEQTYDSRIHTEWKGRNYQKFSQKYEKLKQGMESLINVLTTAKREVTETLRSKKSDLFFERNVVAQVLGFIAQVQSELNALG